MKCFILTSVLCLVAAVAFAAPGAVLDNNNGQSGDILVNTGTKVLGQDQGTWVDPASVPELKGEQGDKGEQGESIKGDKGDEGQGFEYRNPIVISFDNLIPISKDKSLQMRVKPTYDLMNRETRTKGFGGEVGIIKQW